MKRLITALLLLVAIGVSAQTDDSTKYLWYKTQYGDRKPRFWADQAAQMPLKEFSTTPARPGGIRWNVQDSTLEGWTGGRWKAIGVNGGNTLTPGNGIQFNSNAVSLGDLTGNTNLFGNYNYNRTHKGMRFVVDDTFLIEAGSGNIMSFGTTNFGAAWTSDGNFLIGATEIVFDYGKVMFEGPSPLLIPRLNNNAGFSQSNGDIYYDLLTNKFKGYEAGTWKDIITTAQNIMNADLTSTGNRSQNLGTNWLRFGSEYNFDPSIDYVAINEEGPGILIQSDGNAAANGGIRFRDIQDPTTIANISGFYGGLNLSSARSGQTGNISMGPGYVSLQTYDAVKTRGINLSTQFDGIQAYDNQDSVGFFYDKDYRDSALLKQPNRWIPDIAAVRKEISDSLGNAGGVPEAEQGTSIAGGKVVLGQEVGAPGNPAMITSMRELPTNGNGLMLTVPGLDPLIYSVLGANAIAIQGNKGGPIGASATFGLSDVTGDRLYITRADLDDGYEWKMISDGNSGIDKVGMHMLTSRKSWQFNNADGPTGWYGDFFNIEGSAYIRDSLRVANMPNKDTAHYVVVYNEGDSTFGKRRADSLVSANQGLSLNEGALRLGQVTDDPDGPAKMTGDSAYIPLGTTILRFMMGGLGGNLDIGTFAGFFPSLTMDFTPFPNNITRIIPSQISVSGTAGVTGAGQISWGDVNEYHSSSAIAAFTDSTTFRIQNIAGGASLYFRPNGTVATNSGPAKDYDFSTLDMYSSMIVTQGIYGDADNSNTVNIAGSPESIDVGQVRIGDTEYGFVFDAPTKRFGLGTYLTTPAAKLDIKGKLKVDSLDDENDAEYIVTYNSSGKLLKKVPYMPFVISQLGESDEGNTFTLTRNTLERTLICDVSMDGGLSINVTPTREGQKLSVKMKSCGSESCFVALTTTEGTFDSGGTLFVMDSEQCYVWQWDGDTWIQLR